MGESAAPTTARGGPAMPRHELTKLVMMAARPGASTMVCRYTSPGWPSCSAGTALPMGMAR